MEFSIEFYESIDGRPVVADELEAMARASPILHALLLAGLNKLKRREFHRLPLSSPIGDGLFEVRVGHKNIARGLWFFQHSQRIVVVRCFVKKSQKTPSGDLELARKRMNEYLARRQE